MFDMFLPQQNNNSCNAQFSVDHHYGTVKPLKPHLFITGDTSSIMGTTSWYSFTDCRTVYIYIWPTISGHTSSTLRRLDTSNKISTAPRFWHIWMPSINHTTHELLYPPERHWWVIAFWNFQFITIIMHPVLYTHTPIINATYCTS